MSYDSFTSYRRPWDSYRGSQPSSSSTTRSTRPSSSSSTTRYSSYSSCPPRGLPAGKGARRLTSSSYSCSGLPDGMVRMDLAQASSLNTETLGLRAQEKEQLVGLNDRFATYIEKVHSLEQQHRALSAELEALRRRQSEPSRLQQLYEVEVRGLRGRVEAENGDRMRMEAEREYLREVREQLKERYEEEVRLRQEAEEALQGAREEADRAVLSNCDAEAGVVSLAEEILFLRKVFEEERVELQAQLQAASITLDVEVSRPDLSAALREIRAQYERLASKNMQSAEEWYRSKFAGVAEMASRNNEAVHAIREETVEYRRLLQSRSSEIEALRNVIGSLHQQLEALEDRQRGDVAKHQARINDLERDINDAKREMARYLRDYQDLLNVKMALDIEIAAYRKLLEVEECRLTCSSFN